MDQNKINIFKKCIFFGLIIIAIVIVISIVIKYHVVGEESLPYSIEKILIVSRVDATDNEDTEHLWNINLQETNNIFIYFKKNENAQNDTIKEIKINNFNITKSPKIGNIAIYRPTGDLGIDLYKLSEQNYLNNEIVYTGAKVDTLKTLEIRNEGGMIGFRVSLEDLGNFVANEIENDEIIYDGNLLTKIGVKQEDIQFSVSFDLSITLDSDITFKGNISLDLPSGNIIEEKEPHIEITDFSNVVFKRI